MFLLTFVLLWVLCKVLCWNDSRKVWLVFLLDAADPPLGGQNSHDCENRQERAGLGERKAGAVLQILSLDDFKMSNKWKGKLLNTPTS